MHRSILVSFENILKCVTCLGAAAPASHILWIHHWLAVTQLMFFHTGCGIVWRRTVLHGIASGVKAPLVVVHTRCDALKS